MNTTISSEQRAADIAHFAWCALIAMRLAQHEGQALSSLASHSFLMRWLAVARKQHRFPRHVAPQIDQLLVFGREKGPMASLCSRLELLYLPDEQDVPQHSALFRLVSAIEQIKAQGWINAAVTDEEWNTPELLSDYDNTNAILVKKSQLTRSFSSTGILIAPVNFLVRGDQDLVPQILEAHNFKSVLTMHSGGWVQLAIQSDIDGYR
jgi:hypothetical protein